jgi:putative hydrolase
MTATMSAPDDMATDDPMAQMMAGLSEMMAPMMLGMTTGSMVGNLARTSLGGYSLPVPRPTDAPLLILLPNVDHFGDEWSLDRDDLRLWVCLHEVAHHAVLGVPHVRERLTNLLQRHAAGFERDPHGIGETLGDFDLSAGPDALAELQNTLGDPDALLGAVRSPAQEALQPELTALVAAITGYVDHIMDQTGGPLIGSYEMLTEALRRRRVETDASDRFVERILGLELDRAQYERGAAFAAGIVERAGTEGLNRLLSDVANLPTPAEVDAPGLWLARIDLPG